MSDTARKLSLRTILLTTLLLLALSFAGLLLWLLPNAPGDEVSLDQLERQISQNRIERAVFQGEDALVLATLKPLPRAADALLPPKRPPPVWTAYPRNDLTASRLIDQLVRAGARVEVDAQSGKATVRLIVTTLLPTLILANLFALLFIRKKDDDSSVSEVANFGKSGSGNPVEAPSVSFKDVAGAEEAVVELREVVDYLKNPTKYEQLGAVPPKGVLLFGPPGCGKTLLARAVAGEAGVNFFSASGAEFVESLVGVGAARVRDLFASARAAAPAIVFIDEIDAAGRRRGSGSGGGSDERDQTLIQMLVEMDGFAASQGIVVMAATNRPDILDPALLRPGRFDRHVTVDRPDMLRRQAILKLHVRDRPLGAGVDLALVARQTPGFTGADLANVVNEAILLTIRAGRNTIDGAAFSEAVQRIIAGPKRGGHLLTEEERKRVAYHESGHALVATLEGRGGDLHRLSIIARGHGLGTTLIQRQETGAVLTQAQLEARMSILFAGREAERLMFAEISSGPEQDLAEATRTARDMIGRYGMSDVFGGMRLLQNEGADFLGGSLALAPMSGATLAQFDVEVRRVLETAAARARQHLITHKVRLDRVAAALLERESIEGQALLALLKEV